MEYKIFKDYIIVPNNIIRYDYIMMLSDDKFEFNTINNDIFKLDRYHYLKFKAYYLAWLNKQNVDYWKPSLLSLIYERLLYFKQNHGELNTSENETLYNGFTISERFENNVIYCYWKDSFCVFDYREFLKCSDKIHMIEYVFNYLVKTSELKELSIKEREKFYWNWG